MQTIRISTGSSVIIDFEHGEIAGIFHGAQQLNEGRVPMFAVKLRDRAGKSRVISARECTFLSFDGKIACYAADAVEVALSLKTENDGLVWRINVTNKTQDLLEWVELMSFSVCKALQDEENGKGEIIYPYNEPMPRANGTTDSAVSAINRSIPFVSFIFKTLPPHSFRRIN